MPDSEIIQLILEEDEQGLTEFLKRYEPLIRYVINPILKNPEDAEECLSDVILRVWEKIRLYDSSCGSFKGWLTAVSRNTALNYTVRSRQKYYSEEITADSQAEDPTPEEEILRRERQQRLEKIIDNLMPAEKILFYRKYYYMQSKEQMAAEMGTVELFSTKWLDGLRQKLRSCFSPGISDDELDMALTEYAHGIPPKKWSVM